MTEKQMRSRIKALERALAPFAREALEWSATVSDGYRPGVSEPGHKFVYDKATFSIDHCRRAAQLLGQPIYP